MDVKLDFEPHAPAGVKVSFWYFNEGERVKQGENLVEVLTDDAACTLPAPASGRLVKILAPEQAAARAGDVIAVIEED
ncbi:MAG TPA: hypothetical protein ENN09_00420 [Planctomycetes bacterium]|nr:hypothetical protein [Planctomycetota bacterium]